MVYSTIYEILEQAEQKYGAEDAVRYKVKKDVIEAKTYRQLKEDSEKFSGVLQSLGEQGSHIAIIGATSYSWLVSYFGIVNSSSVAVPLDVSLPAKELCELIDRADVTVLVLDEIRKDMLEIVKQQCPKLKHIISMQQEESTEEILSFWQLLQKQKEGWNQPPKPQQLCTIMFTSGTTGKSKGVMLTHRNMAENATCLDMKIPPRTVVLSVLPIHHAYCLSMDVLKGFSLGSILCINDSLLRVAKNIKLFQPNMILMVPMMIESMAKKIEDAIGMLKAANTASAENAANATNVECTEKDASDGKIPEGILKKIKNEVFGEQFHTICSGGAYLNPALIDFFEQCGITILQGYGMTECSPVISTSVSWNRKRESVGQLMPNCEAKIVDNEIWVRGSSVMQGYYKMPEETEQTLQDGWLKTGDLGYIDNDSFVFLTGRKKNLIITKNGENVSPEELENKIGENRLVQEILVRESEGLIEAEIYPNYEYAEKEGIKAEEVLQELIDKYNQEVPPYKRVYHLKIRQTEFEKTTSKKIKRY